MKIELTNSQLSHIRVALRLAKTYNLSSEDRSSYERGKLQNQEFEKVLNLIDKQILSHG